MFLHQHTHWISTNKTIEFLQAKDLLVFPCPAFSLEFLVPTTLVSPRAWSFAFPAYAVAHTLSPPGPGLCLFGLFLGGSAPVPPPPWDTCGPFQVSALSFPSFGHGITRAPGWCWGWWSALGMDWEENKGGRDWHWMSMLWIRFPGMGTLHLQKPKWLKLEWFLPDPRERRSEEKERIKVIGCISNGCELDWGGWFRR